MSEEAWFFNEAVCLLRDARRVMAYGRTAAEVTLVAEIDEALPEIQAALESTVKRLSHDREDA